MQTLISTTITGYFEVILEQVLCFCCRLSITAEDAEGSDCIASFNLQYSIHAEYLVSLAAVWESSVYACVVQFSEDFLFLSNSKYW